MTRPAIAQTGAVEHIKDMDDAPLFGLWRSCQHFAEAGSIPDAVSQSEDVLPNAAPTLPRHDAKQQFLATRAARSQNWVAIAFVKDGAVRPTSSNQLRKYDAVRRDTGTWSNDGYTALEAIDHPQFTRDLDAPAAQASETPQTLLENLAHLKVDSPNNTSLPLILKAELVPLEQRLADHFEVPPSVDDVYERREAALQGRYCALLEAEGHEVRRHKIPVSGSLHAMYTDLFDATTGELVEVKALADRSTVRLGLGQLLDYGRFVDHVGCALLLPSRPGQDLIDLLHLYRVSAIWEEQEGVFVRCDANEAD